MAITDIIKKGFSIVHKNIPLLGILFVFNLIGAVLRFKFGGVGPAPGATPPAPSPGLAVFSILFAVVSVFIFSGTLGVLREFIKTQKCLAADFIQHGKKYFLKILGVWVLSALVVMVFALLVALGVFLGGAIKNLLGSVLAAAIVLIAGGIGIYVFLLLMMAPYAVVVDEAGPIPALKKSIEFVRGSILKVLGLFLLLVLISMGLGFIMGVGIGLFSLILKGTIGMIFVGIITSAYNAYINILLPACFLLFYMASQALKQETAAGPSTAPTA